jgi:hypothetical protein
MYWRMEKELQAFLTLAQVVSFYIPKEGTLVLILLLFNHFVYIHIHVQGRAYFIFIQAAEVNSVGYPRHNSKNL